MTSSEQTACRDLFLANDNSALFVTSQLRPRELKMADGLRRLGWKVGLIYYKWTPFEPHAYFDACLAVGSAAEAHELAMQLTPRICHVFSGAIDDLVLTFCRQKPSPVVIDLNDVFAPSLFDYCHERFEPTREALALADGFCARDLQVKSAEHADGFKLPQRLIFFPEYGWNTESLSNQIAEREASDEVHVVSVGTFSLETQGMYDSCYLQMTQMMIGQGIHFHIYPHWAYRRDHSGSPHAKFEQDFAEFIALQEQNPYLHLHDSLPIEELAKVLPRYDFGLVSGGAPEFGQKLGFYYPAYLETCYSGRISDYLDARLPVLINEEVKFDYWLLKRYGIGIDLKGVLAPGFKERLLQLKRDPRQRQAMDRAVQALSLAANAPRLAAYYQGLMVASNSTMVEATQDQSAPPPATVEPTPAIADASVTPPAALAAPPTGQLVAALKAKIRWASPRLAKIILPYRAIRIFEYRLHNALQDLQANTGVIAGLNARVGSLQQEADQSREKIAALEQANGGLASELAVRGQENAALSADRTALDQARETLTADLAALQREMDSQATEIAALRQEAHSHRVQISRLEDDRTALNIAAAESHQAKTTLLAELARSEGQRNALGAQVSALETERIASSARLGGLERDKAHLGTALADTRQANERLSANLLELEREKAALNSSVARLEQDKAAVSAERAELSGQNTALGIATATLERDKLELAARIDSLLQRESEFRGTVAELKQEKASLESRLQGLEHDKHALFERVAALEEANAGLLATVAGLEQSTAARSSQIEQLAQEKEALRGLVASLEEKRASMGAAIAAPEQDKASIRSQVASLENDKTALRAQIEGLEAERLESRLNSSALEKTKSALETKLASLVQVSDALQKQVAERDQNMATLVIKISELQEENKDRQAAVEDLQTKLGRYVGLTERERLIPAANHLSSKLWEAIHLDDENYKPIDDEAKLLLACMPKSGSTWLTSILEEKLALAPKRLYLEADRNEQELDANAMFQSWGQKTLFVQQHVRYSRILMRVCRAFSTKVVVLTRRLDDVVVSLRDHIESESPEVSMFYTESNWFKGKSESEQFDFIIDHAMPWYFNFFLGWERAASENPEQILMVRYEDLIGNPVTVVETIAGFYGAELQGLTLQELDKRDGTRFNQGRVGRGKELLSRKQLTRLKKLSSYYPESDFAAIGI